MSELKVGRPARGTDSGRPIMVLLDALGRRGALRVLWELRDRRQLTFRQLVEACESNPGALNTRLKELRDLELVDHRAGGYLLTGHGQRAAKIVASLSRFAEGWSRDLAEREPASDA